jgi:hypothetical protein
MKKIKTTLAGFEKLQQEGWIIQDTIMTTWICSYCWYKNNQVDYYEMFHPNCKDIIQVTIIDDPEDSKCCNCLWY